MNVKREPYLSCKVRLTVLNVSPFTTTIQLSLLENVNYTKKNVETVHDSLFYYIFANIMKKRPLILTFTSDMKSYIVSNSEEISADLSKSPNKSDLWRYSFRISRPHIQLQ